MSTLALGYIRTVYWMEAITRPLGCRSNPHGREKEDNSRESESKHSLSL